MKTYMNIQRIVILVKPRKGILGKKKVAVMFTSNRKENYPKGKVKKFSSRIKHPHEYKMPQHVA